MNMYVSKHESACLLCFGLCLYLYFWAAATCRGPLWLNSVGEVTQSYTATLHHCADRPSQGSASIPFRAISSNWCGISPTQRHHGKWYSKLISTVRSMTPTCASLLVCGSKDKFNWCVSIYINILKRCDKNLCRRYLLCYCLNTVCVV